MTLKEKIQKDLITAVRTKEELKSLVLRSLSAAILNKEKEKRYKLSKEKPQLTLTELEKESQLRDEEVIEIICSELKKRKEAILEFEKGKRPNLVEKEKRELEILQSYLPEQLSPQQIKKLALAVIKKVGAKEVKDLGKVMAVLMPQVKGRAEGSQVSKIVKELLSSKT